MFLDQNRKLVCVLTSAKTTLNLPVLADVVDLTSTTTTAVPQLNTYTNGTTPVDIVSSPAASTTRKINSLTIYGRDTASKVVRIYGVDATGTTGLITAGAFVTGNTYQIVSVGTTDFTLIGASANTVGVIFDATGVGTGTGTASTCYQQIDMTLQVDDTLGYTDTQGWYSLDSSGSIKEVASGTLFGNITVAGIETDTAVGTQKVISQDASKFREGQQSTLTSGTAYTTNGSLLIMKAFLHNTGIDTSGNFTAADATDYCSAILYSEDDKLKGFGTSAAVTAGNTPTLVYNWSLDNITGNGWVNGLFTQGDPTAPAGPTQLGGMFSTNTSAGTNLLLRKSTATGSSAPGLTFLRSRGSNASPSAVISGDLLMNYYCAGFDGTNYVNSGGIIGYCEGTIGTGAVPGVLSFRTANSSGLITEALRIDSSQNVNTLVAAQLNSKLLYSATAPTISSGFGTSPSITANGTLTFRLNVGTGGTASSGVIGLPTASTGWNVQVTVFNPTATNLLHTTAQTASTTSSATITNYLTSTGAATAWPASTVLIVTAVAY